MTMELRTAGGALITRHFESWGGWHASWPQPIIATVNAALYFQKIGVRTYSAKVTMLFGQGWSDGSIDDLEVLRNRAHDLTSLDFTDKEGWTRPVLCVIDEETETMDEIKTRSIYRVTATLHREGYIA